MSALSTAIAITLLVQSVIALILVITQRIERKVK